VIFYQDVLASRPRMSASGWSLEIPWHTTHTGRASKIGKKPF